MTTPHSVPSVSTQSDVIDLSKLFGLLLDAKWFILLITVLSILCGIAVALLSTPIYKADALIQIESKNSGGIGSLVGDVGELFLQESTATTEIEIIRSRMILSETVDKYNLEIVAKPKYFPIIGKGMARLNGEMNLIKASHFVIPSYALNFSHSIKILNAENQTYQLIRENEQVVLQGQVGKLAQSQGYELFITQLESSNANQEFSIGLQSQLSAIEWLKSSLSVSERGKQTGILQLNFSGENSAQNVELLNHISQTYFLQNVARNSAEAENSLLFLNEQIPSVRDNLTVAEDALNRFRQDNETVDLGLEAQASLNLMLSLESQLNDLVFQESELRQRFTQDHPTYKSLLVKRKTLLAEKNRLEQQMQQLPGTQREVLRFTRDVEVNQQIYVQLLNKIQELNVVKAGTVGNVRILDKAQSFPAPTKPKKSLIVVIATMLGGMLSVAIVLIKSALHRGVENTDEIENIGLPVYANIPKSDEQIALTHKLSRKKRPIDLTMLAEQNPADLAIEALRSLRTSMHFAMMESKNNILMISGTTEGIGKSFVAINYAAVSVKTGQKVLLIDADMRKGGLHRWFGVIGEEGKNGLSDWLSGRIHLEHAIKKSNIENLHILTRGQIPPNPSELLMHPRFKQLLDWANDHYDLIIIDTPPVLAVTDPGIVGAFAGTTLMVARFGETTAKEIDIARSRFSQAGIEVKGVILNAVEKRAASAYGYYHYKYTDSR